MLVNCRTISHPQHLENNVDRTNMKYETGFDRVKKIFARKYLTVIKVQVSNQNFHKHTKRFVENVFVYQSSYLAGLCDIFFIRT